MNEAKCPVSQYRLHLLENIQDMCTSIMNREVGDSTDWYEVEDREDPRTRILLALDRIIADVEEIREQAW